MYVTMMRTAEPSVEERAAGVARVVVTKERVGRDEGLVIVIGCARWGACSRWHPATARAEDNQFCPVPARADLRSGFQAVGFARMTM